MKKTALLTTLMLLLIACAGSKSKGNAEDQPQRSDYTFKVTFNDIGGGWSNGLTVQGYCQGEETDFSFEPDELAGQYDEDARENIEWIREPDIDFDGEPDLLIYIGMPPYEMFHAFRWLPEEATFEHVDNFTDILNPVVDKQAKAIRSQYRNNSGDSLITEVWKWKQGKLQCVDRKSQSYSESLPDRSARTFKHPSSLTRMTSGSPRYMFRNMPMASQLTSTALTTSADPSTIHRPRISPGSAILTSISTDSPTCSFMWD